MKVKINITKTVFENAETYFEAAKKARKKMIGAKAALLDAKKQLEAEEKKSDQALQKHAEQAIKKVMRKKEWYENFRWFFTSKGHLVIGGRDATTNEIVIKKHMIDTDVVFHTDMAGSPFFVIKLDGGEVAPEELVEVAQATISFSRAWKLGVNNADVFWVKPEQVSKEANTGEYIGKGAFMIRGKTNYVRTLGDCAVGLVDGRLECAPSASLKGRAEKLIKIAQGSEKSSDIAKKIQKMMGTGELDEIIRILPSGDMKIVP